MLTLRLADAETAEEAAEFAEALRQAYGESPSPSAEALYAQSMLVVADGDAEAALFKLDRAIELDDELVSAYILRGRIHLSEGEVDEAYDDAMAAAGMAPRYYAALSLLAQTFEARGLTANALITTREALRRYPLNEALQEQMEEFEALAAGAGL